MTDLIKIPFYPGCTLSQKAENFLKTAVLSFKVLGIELSELPNWYCCQADYSLVSDNLMALLASSRNLVAAKKIGEELAVSCSTCYNVLKRTNLLLKNDQEKRKTITDFLEEEYDGSVKIVHLLEILRDRIGFENITKKVKRKLTGLKIAPYYGCLLLRPADEMKFDDPENPTIFEEFLKSLGAEPVDFAYKSECCGSYLVIPETNVVIECADRILKSAIKNNANLVITSCPLCQFNLDWPQETIKKKRDSYNAIPIFYFTEILAYALGVIDEFDAERHFVKPEIKI